MSSSVIGPCRVAAETCGNMHGTCAALSSCIAHAGSRVLHALWAPNVGSLSLLLRLENVGELRKDGDLPQKL